MSSALDPNKRVAAAELPHFSVFFLHGWARAWSKIAFGNYMEAMDRAAGRCQHGPNYRAYWRGLQSKVRTRLGNAALRSGASLKFGPFNSVEVNILNKSDMPRGGQGAAVPAAGGARL